MSLYSKLTIVILLVVLTFLSYAWFLKTQIEIDIFWREKFKPDFLAFPLNEVIITKGEFEKIHMLYNYLAMLTGLFAMFFVLLIFEAIELFRAYMRRNPAS